MPTFRTATVLEVLSERPGLQRLSVSPTLPSEVSGRDPGEGVERAYALTDLVGTVAAGDEVVLNTTAVELGLGTGGWHVVHWNLSNRRLELPGRDHVMKLRYTSLQAEVGTDELNHPDAADRRLGGRPVVACTLHSQVALVALGFAHAAPRRRLAYVMTDGAALPLALSDLVVSLAAHGLLCGTVTAGHAFGGDLEAVSVPAALGLAAHVLEADAIVVGMGPGVVGTGTRFGTTAVEAAAVIDAAAARGGDPVLCVRASGADARERHRGGGARGHSHHVDAVLSLCHTHPWVASVGAEALPVAGDAPTGTPGVRVAEVEVPDPGDLIERAGLRVTSMGRDHRDDPLFFRAGVAAGVVAAGLLGDR